MVAEGGDYSPIQQSYELRKLRAENLRLKELLRAGAFPLIDEQNERPTSSDRPMVETPWKRAMKRSASSRQKRFKSQEQSDNLYFGSPSLANVINDVRNLLTFNCESLLFLIMCVVCQAPSRPAVLDACHATGCRHLCSAEPPRVSIRNYVAGVPAGLHPGSFELFASEGRASGLS